MTDHRGADASEFDATLAVVAHGLLTSMSVIQGANLMLRQDWDRLARDRREELLDMALLQAQHTIGVLQDLMRGVAPDIAAELDALTAARGTPPGLELR